MNTQPKSKALVIIIGILLIANIVTLSLFFMNKNEGRSGRADRKAQITSFLKKDVGFTESQLSKYDTLSKEHRTAIKAIFDDMSAGREDIFKQLAAQQFSDSAMDIAANAIAAQQKTFELKMLQHLKEIRNICTPEQQLVFDTGFYKIIAKRGSDSRKDKEQSKQ